MNDDDEKKTNNETLDEYFECVETCGIRDDECVIECVHILKENNEHE